MPEKGTPAQAIASTEKSAPAKAQWPRAYGGTLQQPSPSRFDGNPQQSSSSGILQQRSTSAKAQRQPSFDNKARRADVSDGALQQPPASIKAQQPLAFGNKTQSAYAPSETCQQPSDSTKAQRQLSTDNMAQRASAPGETWQQPSASTKAQRQLSSDNKAQRADVPVTSDLDEYSNFGDDSQVMLTAERFAGTSVRNVTTSSVPISHEGTFVAMRRLM